MRNLFHKPVHIISLILSLDNLSDRQFRHCKLPALKDRGYSRTKRTIEAQTKGLKIVQDN